MAHAGPPAQRLVAGDPIANGNFGLGVAIDGTTLVIGEENDNERAADAGAAYVLELEGGRWVIRDKIMASDGFENAHFGREIAIDKNMMAVSSRAHDQDGNWTRSVYVLERQGNLWQERAHLLPEGYPQYTYFGLAMAVEDGILVVGDWGDDDTVLDAGAIYIYERIEGQWIRQAKMQAPEPRRDGGFGYDVAINDGVIVVGNQSFDIHTADRQRVWIIERGSDRWEVRAVLSPSDLSDGDAFGSAVAVDDSSILIGAPGKDVHGRASGAVFVFRRVNDAWEEVALLAPSDGDENDTFGDYLSLDGPLAVISAPNDEDHYGSPRGTAYVFERLGDAWQEVRELGDPHGASFDCFGYGLGVSGSHVVVGVPGESNGDQTEGAAYAFVIAECPADIDCDGDADAEDFFLFLDAFSSDKGDLCDLDRDGQCNPDDFFRFLDLLALGCER